VSGVVDEGSSKPALASPTGLVVVSDLIGEGSVQEQSVVGETPNLAASLQALAAPGLSRAGKQTIFAFVPAALGLLALILTAAAVQIVGAGWRD